MALVTPARPDALRPTASKAQRAWAERVRADREQVERLRESTDAPDFYAPVADRFRVDPRRRDDPIVEALLALTGERDTWLDIGAGGGRYALPLALAAREVVAVEPSVSMRHVLEAGAAEVGVENVRVHPFRWPPDGWPAPEAVEPFRADLALMAHVGYDIEAIGPFLDAMEAAVRRRCVAILGEGAMTTVATLFWEPVHGEPRVPLPALPELVTLLFARGRLPEVTLADRIPPAFDDVADIQAMARRQLWVAPGSPKDRLLERLVVELATERNGRWALEWTKTAIGVVTWEPR